MRADAYLSALRPLKKKYSSISKRYGD